ncbi:MAG: dihydroorotate dehydrogenase (quinone), partial [Alphaproteobacteria bacterium]
LLKIAPDMDEDALSALLAAVLEAPIAGLVVSNTTVARPEGLRGAHADEPGGLSGRPLFASSTRLLARVYALTGGRLPLVGVGGIASAADAYAKIRAGASLIELYSALVYRGPGLVLEILRQLPALLRADGFASLEEAIGADHR